jgi:hypothetical protein
MNRVDERLWVVEIAFNKTPKTVLDWHVKLSVIRRCTGVGFKLEKAHSLVTTRRCIPVIFLIPLELDFSMAYTVRTEDVGTHRSLSTNRLYHHLAVRNCGDTGRPVACTVKTNRCQLLKIRQHDIHSGCC